MIAKVFATGPIGPLCYSWYAPDEDMESYCDHTSCWSIMAWDNDMGFWFRKVEE